MPINTPTGYLDITNATLRGSKIVTTGYVGIANANPTNHLSIGSNLHINDTHSNVLQVSGNINAASVVLGGLSIAPTFDLEIVTNTGNTTPYTVEFNNTATAFVTTANATIGDTLTASKLVGDGSGISAIQSSNVTDFGSNVSRITALESSRALGSDLDNNSSRITTVSSDLSDNSSRITTVSNDLGDNSSRITTLESGDFSISGEKTFTGQVIFESNIHMAGGNVLVANTVNMTVSDPIIELGSNNLNTGDLGIVMTRHGATNSNIAFIYDESDDILRMGYTLNGASSSVVYLDSNALAVGVQGTMTADKIVASNVLPATSTTTGALTVAGGVGVEGNVHCTNLYANNITMNLVSFSGLQTFEQVVNNGRVLNSNVLIISNATPSTSSATGALTLTGGGLGVEGNVYIGSNLSVTDETTLSNLTVTEETALSNISVTGETVEVANLAVTSGSLELTQVANVFQVKSSANVVTEYVRSKKLIKYPRVAMTGPNDGSGYVVTQASGTTWDTTNATNNRNAWALFDGVLIEKSGHAAPHFKAASGTGNFDSSGNYTGTNSLGGVDGDWVSIQLPVKIQLHSVNYWRRGSTTRQVVDASVLGSVDGTNWDLIGTWRNAMYGDSHVTSFPMESAKYHNYIALVMEKINGADGYPNFHELELFGIPEYDPDAHGTDVIARSVPNVPNTDWLEVYYDGQDYTSMPSSVTDKSGNSVTGTPTGGVTFDSTWKAFTFGGSDLHNIWAPITLSGGDYVHSWAAWAKFDNKTNSCYVFGLGNANGSQSIGFHTTPPTALHNGEFRYFFYGNDLDVPFNYQPDTWYHICGTYSGGGTSLETVRLYINGIHMPGDPDNNLGSVLQTPTSTTLYIGRAPWSGSRLNGQVANFRLFNRALTGDEIWQLYAYQKDYFQVSPDALTFKGGRLGIGTLEPKAVLDVNGDLYARGSVVQVVQAIKTNVASTNSTGFVDTGLEVTITPKSSSSKILVSYAANIGTNTSHAFLRLVRNGTPIAIGDAAGSRVQCTHYVRHFNSQSMESYCMEFLDSPSTASAVTYKLQYSVASTSYTITLNRAHNDGDNVYYGRGVSTITAKEIAQ